MAIIDPGNPAATDSASTLRGDYLKNLYILREAYQKAIFELLKAGVKTFTIDTGQNPQTVTRQDIPALTSSLKTISDLIAAEEASTGDAPAVPGQLIQVVPF
jgi:hypothetical protein